MCHGAGELARDDDGDGFCEVHVITLEGFWSLLRSWLRPHRGISQESLPLYLGFFEFVHNVRARGKRLLGALIGQLLAPPQSPLSASEKSSPAKAVVETEPSGTRQDDLHDKARIGVAGYDVTVMNRDRPAGDGKAKAGPAALPAAVILDPEERLKE